MQSLLHLLPMRSDECDLGEQWIKTGLLRSMARGVALLTERTWKLGPWRRHCCLVLHGLQVILSQIHTHLVRHPRHILEFTSLTVVVPHLLCPFYCLPIWLSEEKRRWLWFCSSPFFFFYWSVVDTQGYICFRQHSDPTNLYDVLCSAQVQLTILHFSGATSGEK